LSRVHFIIRDVSEEFSDATLVLIGHGSTKNENSAAPVYQHAAELRSRKIFGDVREAFWKIEPKIADVLRDVSAKRIFVVPIFISEGYFTNEAIPRELGLPSGNLSLVSLFYCKPVGTHESMTEIILSRARDVAEKFPFPRSPKLKDTALFIAGHGTEQNENSRQSIERQVEQIRCQNIYAEVHPLFIEEEPRIARCYEMSSAKNFVIVPFFISDGLHVDEDIPILLGEPERIVRQRLSEGKPTWRNPTERNGKLVWYSRAVGSEPGIANVILERVREAMMF
jgi:sirohydrochlorin cobaltochelatase